MTSNGPLTGDEVRRVVFARPPFGRRGYDTHQVDQFMQRVAATLDGADTLTADEVHNVIFGKPPVGDRGYREDEVDALLDIVSSALRNRADGGDRADADADRPAAHARGARPAPPTGSQDRPEPLAGYQLRQAAFPIAALGGYDKQQVDEFMDRAADTLDGSGGPLSAEQVAGVRFDRPRGLRRGYQADEVNTMIDRIEAELRRRSAGW